MTELDVKQVGWGFGSRSFSSFSSCSSIMHTGKAQAAQGLAGSRCRWTMQRQQLWSACLWCVQLAAAALPGGGSSVEEGCAGLAGQVRENIALRRGFLVAGGEHGEPNCCSLADCRGCASLFVLHSHTQQVHGKSGWLWLHVRLCNLKCCLLPGCRLGRCLAVMPI